MLLSVHAVLYSLSTFGTVLCFGRQLSDGKRKNALWTRFGTFLSLFLMVRTTTENNLVSPNTDKKDHADGNKVVFLDCINFECVCIGSSQKKRLSVWVKRPGMSTSLQAMDISIH